jgi:hypothetical protein
MAYTPKTKVTDQKVDDFLETVSETRRQEAYEIIDMMKRVSGEKPRIWGSSMIGFGTYHYVSKGKCEADWFKIGFSPRKAKISFYVSCDADEFSNELLQLGKHTRGKGCIYANKLGDIDMNVMENIARAAYINTNDYDARLN